MKNFILLIAVLTLLASCNLIFDLQPDKDIATFQFSDEEGYSIFSDSLVFEDFSVSTLTGNAQLLRIDSSAGARLYRVPKYTKNHTMRQRHRYATIVRRQGLLSIVG